MQKWHLYHYNDGDVSGNIVDFIGDFIQYKIEPEICLGSPLLNEDHDVIGIHACLWESSNESAPTLFVILFILNLFLFKNEKSIKFQILKF